MWALTITGRSTCLEVCQTLGFLGSRAPRPTERTGCKYDELPELGCDTSRPIERWLLPLEDGHTPENHPIAKITEGWIVDWIATHSAS